MDIKRRTAQSFGYEWQRFSTSPLEMEANFRGYFQFFAPHFFEGKQVLEVGSGMGRHTHFLANYASQVTAIDLSAAAIRVTASNVHRHRNVSLVQADIDDLPFRDESFDFICAIGVLHHLEDPERSFNQLLRCLRPGGFVHVYLYHSLEDDPAWKRSLLILVSILRHLTIRMPHQVLEKIAWLVALGGFFMFSLPYRYLSRVPATRDFAETLPLKRYAVDGFRVCHNDQFDRLSAPIEKRFTRLQVVALFERAGLVDVRTEAYYGWIACGRKMTMKEINARD